ncbi:CoA transferase [Rhodococcus fascians]|nr:CoA transferase [Rhodococcus fascians]
MQQTEPTIDASAPTVDTGLGRPLEGIRVLDLTRALSGPYATMLLAGLGAEIVKLEDPRIGDLARGNSPYVGRNGVTVTKQYDDDVSISHLTRARGKSGISLDLRAPGAAEVFADLVTVSDVVIENFSSGTADRLGVGWSAVQAANPRAVYCSISGFGAGTDHGSKAMDVIVQALSGAMYTSGEQDGPPVRIGIPLADTLAPLFAVIGILSALRQRDETGVGQQVDVSMLGALTSLVSIENWQAMSMAGMAGRTGLTVPRLSPFGIFPCSDGHVAIVAVNDGLVGRLGLAMGRPELAVDGRYANRDARVANSAVLEDEIREWLRTLTLAEACGALAAHGVPHAPVRTPGEAMQDPRVVSRGETLKVDHPTVPVTADLRTAGVPIVFSSARTGFDPVFATTIGEQNDRVYGELLGYPPERIEELRQSGVV